MSLYHSDRFAHEPDKLATFEKLTAAINGAKDRGDIGTLRQIAGDPLEATNRLRESAEFESYALTAERAKF